MARWSRIFRGQFEEQYIPKQGGVLPVLSETLQGGFYGFGPPWGWETPCSSMKWSQEGDFRVFDILGGGELHIHAPRKPKNGISGILNAHGVGDPIFFLGGALRGGPRGLRGPRRLERPKMPFWPANFTCFQPFVSSQVVKGGNYPGKVTLLEANNSNGGWWAFFRGSGASGDLEESQIMPPPSSQDLKGRYSVMGR